MNVKLLGLLCSGVMLSEIPSPGPTEFYSVLGALASILAIVVLMLAGFYYFKRIREPGIPNPLRVTETHDHVTQKTFEVHCEQLRQEFKDVYKAIAEEGRNRNSQFSDLVKGVAEVTGAFEQSQRRHHPNDR